MATLSFFAPGGSVSGSPLVSTTNLDEHEAIFFSPSELAKEFMRGVNIDYDALESVRERMATLHAWVLRGHTLIVIHPWPIPFSYRANNNIVRTAVENFAPLDGIKFKMKSGKSVEAVGPGNDLLSKFVGSYGVVIDGPGLAPLAVVKTTKNTVGSPDVVAGYVRKGEGLVIFAPAWWPEGTAFWEALAQLPKLLHLEAPDLPSWVDDFKTVVETTLHDEAASRLDAARKLQAEIQQFGEDIARQRQLKTLFTGSGAQFEKAVGDAFIELGIEIIAGPNSRADLLISNGMRIAAVEAKGVEGAVREDYARQLTIWMPEVDMALASPLNERADDQIIQSYKVQLKGLNLQARDPDFDCKGILVIGTFRSLPLTQRLIPDFADNVVQLITRRDICAMTGLQLYSLIIASRADPSLKPKIVEAIFGNSGVLNMGLDWKTNFVHSPA